jgi:mRNA interferase MazF
VQPFQRGDIYQVNWTPERGSEQSGLRAALVIQTDSANRNSNYPNTIVLAVSTKGKPVPLHVRIDPTPENGLTNVSFVKCEQIVTIDKTRLEAYWGRLSDEDMEKIEKSLKIALAL